MVRGPKEGFYEKVYHWLIPFLLSVLVAVLSWMGSNIASISSSLAVAVTRVAELDRRTTTLENIVLHSKP